MANEERLDDLDQQPAAADESGQGFDDPALPELGEKSSELRFLRLRMLFSDLWRCIPLAFRHSRYPFSSQEPEASSVA